MELSKQVVSLELAKELKKAGYKQEGLWWWILNAKHIDGLRKEVSPYWSLVQTLPKEYNLYDSKCVAPTVAELGMRLGKNFIAPHKIRNEIQEEIMQQYWELIHQFNHTEANARAKMWLYLKKNGYLDKEASK